MLASDMNRYERIARAISYGKTVDEAEVQDVLEATKHTREDLERRAEVLRGLRERPRNESELERYAEETKVLGVHEGLVIVIIPLLLMIPVFVVIVGYAMLKGR